MGALTEIDGRRLTVEPAAAGRPATELVGSKYGTPSLREGLVCRAELLGRLEDARAYPLVLVTAPAGYGKTTLLSQWVERGGHPFAWAALDEGDSDPTQMEETIVAAVAWAGIDPTRPGHGFVLVLDDAGRVQPEALGDAVLRVLDWLPEGAQVVLASRREPVLPLGRMRGHGIVLEVGADDMSMSTVEGASLLRKAGLELEFTVVQDLVRRTEGWPVALELAAISLAARPDPGEGAARLAGDDHAVAEYIRAEILATLSRATVRFLTRSSVLDELSGPLCDAVLERTRSAAVLARLARTNVPILPVDPSHERYRVHGLLREMLLTELHRADPGAPSGLHRRACEWYAGKEDLDRAIGHARSAGDLDRTGELLWANLADYLGDGRNDAVQGWIGGITSAQAAGSAPFALAAAHSQLALGNIALAEHWGRSATVALAEEGASTQRAGAVMIEAWAARSGAKGMGEDASRAYAMLSDDSPWRAGCCFLRGTAALLTGETAIATRYLEEGVGRGLSAAPDAAALCLSQLAVIAIDGNDRELAGDFARRARSLILEHNLGSYPVAALAYAASAAACVGEGRIDEAKAAAADCLGLVGIVDELVPWCGAETRILLARGSLALGDVVAAREQLADASRLARRTPDVVVFQRWFEDAWDQFDKRAEAALIGVASLTTAELRVLRFLPTHYAFHEIAERLHVSSNTVKTHVHAVYRKLDASSRSEAVMNATSAGLLGY
jgi:LuxR family maltose regulon positive regulatory protein